MPLTAAKAIADMASDFFSDGVDDHMVATATTVAGDTLIFIDINNNGDLDLASDMVVHISGDAVDGDSFAII